MERLQGLRALADGAPSLAFLLCVEAGPLEAQALLLCRSIRRWGGALASAPVHAYRPREGEPLAESTRVELDALDVRLVEEPLNREHSYYPMANKVHACAHAERHLEAEVLVFCDSDTVFVNEPAELALAPGVDATLRPVGDVGKGSKGPGHKNEPYWQRLYELADVDDPPWVTTMRTGKRIRGYWSSGLIAARRQSGLLGEWLELLSRLLAAGHVPRSGTVNNMDQIALAAALSRRPERIGALDHRYNYVIARRALYEGAMRDADLDELVHLHYTRWFNRPDFLRDLRPALDRRTPQFRWLSGFLPFEPTISEPLWGMEPEGMKGRGGRRRLRERFGTRGSRYRARGPGG